MIKEQFIERDLFNATSLSQLEWRIKGNKLSKEKVVEYLSSKEGREAIKKLGADKVKTLFPKQSRQINEDNFIDILINNLNKDEIYNSIFR